MPLDINVPVYPSNIRNGLVLNLYIYSTDQLSVLHACSNTVMAAVARREWLPRKPLLPAFLDKYGTNLLTILFSAKHDDFTYISESIASI